MKKKALLAVNAAAATALLATATLSILANQKDDKGTRFSKLPKEDQKRILDEFAQVTPQDINEQLKKQKGYGEKELSTNFNPVNFTFQKTNKNGKNFEVKVKITKNPDKTNKDYGLFGWDAIVTIESFDAPKEGVLGGFKLSLTPKQTLDKIKDDIKNFKVNDKTFDSKMPNKDPHNITIAEVNKLIEANVEIIHRYKPQYTNKIISVGDGKITVESSFTISGAQGDAKATFTITGFKSDQAILEDDSISSLTEDMVNKAILKASPFDGTTDPKTYKFPKEVFVELSKKVKIKVALTSGSIDADHGTIAWTAVASNEHGSKTKSLGGILRGFDGPLSTQKKITDAALDKLAKHPELISDAIKKAQHINNQTDPDGHQLPKEVTVPVDGVNIKVKITQPKSDPKDTDNGIVKWEGTATGPHSDKKIDLKDQVDGLKTKKDKEKEAIIDGAKTIDGDKINDAIKKAIEKQTGKKISELEPKDITLPGKIQIPIGGGKEIEVQIKPGKKNAGNGSIDWTGTVVVPGQDPKDAKTINDSLDGLKTTKEKIEKAKEDALAKLTVKDINDALKKAEDFDDSTDPIYYNFNTRLSINIDGVDIDVILTKGAIDSNEGLISWTLKKASVSGIKKTRQDLFGDLEGFASLVKQNIKRDKGVISSITPKDINEAIKKFNPLIDKGGDKKDINNYVIPPKVIITKKAADGQDVRVVVDLTPGKKDPKTGEINWAGKPHTEHVPFDDKKDKAISDKLPGFETNKEKQDRTEQAILDKVTAKDINDAIKASRPVTGTDLASTFAMPKKVTVTIDGNPVTVSLVNKKQDDNLGQVIWDGTATFGSKTKDFNNGHLNGFKIGDALAKKANDKRVLQLLTSKMVNDEILKVKHVGKDVKASVFVMPKNIIVQIEGIDITVQLTAGTSDDNGGLIPWTSSASIVGSKEAPRTDVAGNLTGFETTQDIRDKKVEKQIATITEKMINDAIKKVHSFDDLTDATKYPFPASVSITIGQEVFTVKLTKGFVHTVEGAIEWTAIATDSTTRITQDNLFGTLYGFATSKDIQQKLVDQAIKDVTKQDVIAAIKKAAHVDDHTDASKYPFPTEVVVPKNGINVKVKLTPGAIDNDKGEIEWTGTASAKGSKQTQDLKGTLDGFEDKAAKDRTNAEFVLKKLTEKDINDAILSAQPFDKNTDPAKWKMPSQVTIKLADSKGVEHDITVDLTRRGTNDEKGWIQWTSVASTPNATFSRRDILGTLKGFITRAKKQEKIEEIALANLTADQINNAIKLKYVSTGTTQKPVKPLNSLIASTFNFPTEVDVISGGVSIHVKITKGTVDDDKGQISWDLVSATAPNYKVPRTKALSGTLTGFSNKNQQIIERDNKLLQKVTTDMINAAIKQKQPYDKTKGDKASDYNFPTFVTFTIPGDKTNSTVTAVLTKKVISDVLGEITWVATVSTANAQRTDKLTSKLDNFQTNAEVLTKKANEAVKKVTDDMINKAIKDAQTITDQTDPLNHKLPAEVTIPIDGINVKVKITQPTQDPKDTDKGQIKWTADVSAPNADPKVNGRDVQGKIDGFKTKHQKDQEVADAALQAVTADMINKAIKTKNNFDNTTDPTKWTIPSTVDVTSQGKTVTVKLTAGNIDKVNGTISWMSDMSTPNASGLRKLNGDLSGFATSAKISQKNADDILAKLTEKDINDAILLAQPFDQNTDPANWQIPSQVIVKLADANGVKHNVNVVLTKKSIDDAKGWMQWTSVASTANATKPRNDVAGTLKGFMTAAKKQEKAEKDALVSLTAKQINDAIKDKYNKSGTQHSPVKPLDELVASTFNFPTTIDVISSGVTIHVTLQKGTIDDNKGEINWDLVSATVPHYTNPSGTQALSGTLTGFISGENKLLHDVTTDMINDAIKAKVPYDKTKGDKASNYKFPQTVTFTIPGDKTNTQITATLTKKVISDVLGEITWSATVSTANAHRTDQLASKLGDFETNAEALTKKANEAVKKVTDDMINKAIKDVQTITDQTEPLNHKLPTEVIIPIDGINVKVKITQPTQDPKDTDKGQIKWTAKVSASSADPKVNGRDVKGTIDGFKTKQQKIRDAADSALQGITVQMVNDAIKLDSPFTKATDPKTWVLPTTVDVINHGFTITVKLTAGNVDWVHGTVSWMGSATNPNTTSVKKLNGDLNGFGIFPPKPDTGITQKEADDALAKLTVQDINNAIKSTKGFDTDDLASKYAIPPQVIVPIDGINVTVSLTKASDDDKIGNLSWTASAEVVGKSSAPVKRAGTLSGFSTESLRIKQKENKAVKSITIDDINKAIIGVKPFTNKTDPSTFVLPSKVAITTKDGAKVIVSLTPNGVNKNDGKVNWIAKISSKNGTETRTIPNGELPGFATQSKLDQAKVDKALLKLNEKIINKAIKAKSNFTTTTTTNYSFPGSVDVTIDGINFKVALHAESRDSLLGTISWAIDSTTPSGISNPNLKGVLRGFAVKKPDLVKKEAENTLKSISAQDVIAQIKADRPYSNSDEAKDYNLPKNVVISKDGFKFIVALTKGVVDNNKGKISWTSSVSIDGYKLSPKALNGDLLGFGTDAQRQITKEKDALAKLTEKAINDEIKKIVKPSNSKDPSQVTNFPKNVTVVIDGVPIDVAIVKGDVDKQNGGIDWTSSAKTPHITEPKTDIIGTISGFQKDSKDPSEFNKNILSLLTEKMINDQIKIDHPFTNSDEANTFAFPKQVVVEIHGVDITVTFDPSQQVNNDLGNISWSATGSIGKQTKGVLGKLSGFQTAKERQIILEKNALAKLTDALINDAIKNQTNITKDTDPEKFNFPKEVIVSIDGVNIKVKLDKVFVDKDKGEIKWSSSAKTDNISNPREDIIGNIGGFQDRKAVEREHEKYVVSNITKEEINKAIRNNFKISDEINADDFAKIVAAQPFSFVKEGVKINVNLTPKADSTNTSNGKLPWDAKITTVNEARDINNGILGGFETDALRETRKNNAILAKLTAEDINKAILDSKTPNHLTPDSKKLPSSILKTPDSVIVNIDGVDINVKLSNWFKDDSVGMINWHSEASISGSTSVRKDIFGAINGFKTTSQGGDDLQKIIKVYTNALNSITSDMINHAIKMESIFDDKVYAKKYKFPNSVTVFVDGIPTKVDLTPVKFNNEDGEIKWAAKLTNKYVQSPKNVFGTLTGFAKSKNISPIDQKIIETLQNINEQQINDALKHDFPFTDKVNVEKWARNKEDLDFVTKINGVNIRLKFINKAPMQGPNKFTGLWKWKVEATDATPSVNTKPYKQTLIGTLDGFAKEAIDDAASNDALASVTIDMIKKAMFDEVSVDMKDYDPKIDTTLTFKQNREKGSDHGGTQFNSDYVLEHMLLSDWLKRFDGNVVIKQKNKPDVYVNITNLSNLSQIATGKFVWKADLFTTKGKKTRKINSFSDEFDNSIVNHKEIPQSIIDLAVSEETIRKLLEIWSKQNGVPMDGSVTTDQWLAKFKSKISIDVVTVDFGLLAGIPKYADLLNYGFDNVGIGIPSVTDPKEKSIDSILGRLKLDIHFVEMSFKNPNETFSAQLVEGNYQIQWVSPFRKIQLLGFKKNTSFKKDSDDAINSVTKKMINDEIKKYDDISKRGAFEFRFPKKVIVWVMKSGSLVPITVDLFNPKPDGKNGKISWDAKLSTAFSSIKRELKDGELTGFMKQDEVDARNEMNAIYKINDAWVRDAVKNKTFISTTISPKDAKLPDFVVIQVDGVGVKLKVEKTGINSKTGEVEWKATVVPRFPQNPKKVWNDKFDGFEDHIWSIIHSITKEDINKQIKIDEPFTNLTNAKDYNFPKSITLTIDGETFDVKLTPGLVNNNDGIISWLSKITSKTDTTISEQIGGDLIGFNNSILRQERKETAAINSITVKMINDALIKERAISGEAKKYIFAHKVTIRQNDVNVNVNLTPTVDNEGRIIKWTATFDKGSRTLAGTLTGFDIPAAQQTAAKITNEMINDAIKAKAPFDNKTNSTTFTIPSSVDISVGGKTVTVSLKKTGSNNTIGSAQWEATFPGVSLKRNGILNGFDNAALRAKRKDIADTMASITQDEINKAIANAKSFNRRTNPSTYNMPGNSSIDKGEVVVNKNGYNFVVKLDKLSIDSAKGSIAWNAHISQNGISNTRTMKGDLTGFETDADKTKYGLESVLNSLTKDEINAAIIAKQPITDPENIAKFNMPSSVVVKKHMNGKDFNINVAFDSKHSVDAVNGEIYWSSTASINGISTTKDVVGTLGGFIHFDDANQAKAHRVMKTITAKEINDKIIAAHPYNDSTSAQSYKNSDFPSQISIVKEGVTFTIQLTGSVNESAGKISWTSVITSGKETRNDIVGTLTGFENDTIRQEIKEKNAIDSITEKMINDALANKHAISGEAKDYTFSPSLKFTQNGIDINVHLTPTVDNKGRVITWLATFNNSSRILPGTLTGFDVPSAQQTAAKITNEMINDAIKVKTPFDNTVNSQTFAIPSSVDVVVDGKTVNVKLAKKGANETNGTIQWEATFPGISAKRAGTLSGFDTAALRIKRQAVTNAMAKITQDDINKAIASGRSFNKYTDPSTYNMPGNSSINEGEVVINKDGYSFNVQLRKLVSDNAHGSITWLANISQPAISTVRTMQGQLTGFESSADKINHEAEAVLNSLTEAEINAAIIAKHPITQPDEISKFDMPKFVVVKKHMNGKDYEINVAFNNKHSIDEVDGEIYWSSIASVSGMQKTRGMAGILDGFTHFDSARQAKIHRVIKTITAKEINDKISTDYPYNDQIQASSFKKSTFPKQIVIIKEGITFTIKLTPGTVDENIGSIAWTSVITSGKETRNNLSSTLTGFMDKQGKEARDATTAVYSITSNEIAAAIKAKYNFDNTVEPQTYKGKHGTISLVINKTVNGKVYTFNVEVELKDTTDNGEIKFNHKITTTKLPSDYVGNGILVGFKTKAEKDAEIAKAKAEKAIKLITETDINNKIRSLAPFDKTTAPFDYRDNDLHTTFDITKGGINFGVKLIAKSVNQLTGSIGWNAIISDSSTNTSRTLTDKEISGFQTFSDYVNTLRRNALNKVTVNDINDAIEKARKVSGKPGDYVLPKHVTVSIDGSGVIDHFDIDIDLTKASISKSKGEVRWNATASMNGITDTRNINGTLDGFQNLQEVEEQKANDALDKLTKSMVNAKIKHDSPYSNSDSVGKYKFPSNIVVNIDGKDINVALTPGNRDSLSGSISFTGTATTSGTNRTVQISSSLVGFLDKNGALQKLIDESVHKVTEAEINAAIKKAHYFNSITDTNNYNFPSSVIVTSSGIDVKITFSNHIANRDAGSIAWTAKATANGTKNIVPKSGTLTGFETKAYRDKAASIANDMAIIETITTTDINNAIKALKTVSKATNPNGFTLPSTVVIRKNGKDFNVSLNKVSSSHQFGSVEWHGVITSPRNNVSLNKNGKLTGFETLASKRALEVKKLLTDLTSKEINDAIEQQMNINKGNKASSVPSLRTVHISKGGETINVTFSSVSKDDSKGEIAWTGIASVDGVSVVVDKKGTLSGFKTQNTFDKDNADKQIDLITNTMINKWVKDASPFDNTKLPSKWVFPNELLEQLNGVQIKINKKTSTNYNDLGTVGWFVEISSPKTSKTRSFSGVLRGFKKDSFITNQNDVVLSSVGENEINQAIKKAVPNWASLTSDQINLPPLTFTYQGHTITAKFISTQNGSGSVSWVTELNTSGASGNRIISGTLDGLTIGNNTAVINDMNAITASDINDVIKRESPIGQNTIFTYPVPSNDMVVRKGSHAFKVNIMGSSPDSMGNSIVWKVLITHVDGSSRRMTGFLNGFGQPVIPTNPVDTAINQITAQQITNEIKRQSPIGSNTASQYRVPSQITVMVNQVPVQVTINSKVANNDRGTVKWFATIFASGSSKVRNMEGLISGFAASSSNPTETSIDSITQADVNNAILSVAPINNKTIAQYSLPNSVVVVKNGHRILVNLNSGGTLSNGITWVGVASDGSNPRTTSHTKSILGTLTGFNNAGSGDLQDAKLAKLVKKQINHGMTFGSGTSINNLLPSAFYNRPTVTVKVNNKNLTVNFINTHADDATGTLSWTAQVTGLTSTPQTISGQLKGFKATNGNSDALNVLNGMSSAQIAQILYDANKQNYGRPILFSYMVGDTMVFFEVSKWDFNTATQDTTWTVSIASGGHERTVSGKLSERSNTSPASPMPQAYNAQVEQRSFFANDLTDIYSI
ncbi:hypothetical protein [Mycoplasma marinum]|uniref:Uncharacterized protein n=1 Tax=Mycoplasma marinum TaxID=1937190 RepID=A0A4R0XKB5_9MOLU|nr:hypothetical protein [Mycoplasma marinum]TCG11083.1 hypothetical protein C4B24_03070 [Mycoplasma marinum]